MLVLVIGGSGSGKSAYAEDCVVRLSGENSRYYLATMQIYGEEARARVERHRQLRKEKGFYTIDSADNHSGIADCDFCRNLYAWF